MSDYNDEGDSDIEYSDYYTDKTETKINYPKPYSQSIKPMPKIDQTIKQLIDTEREQEIERLIKLRKKDAIKAWYRDKPGISTLLPLDVDEAYDHVIRLNKIKQEQERLAAAKKTQQHLDKLYDDKKKGRRKRLGPNKQKRIISNVKIKSPLIKQPISSPKQRLEFKQEDIIDINLDIPTEQLFKPAAIKLSSETEMKRRLKLLKAKYNKKKKMLKNRRKQEVIKLYARSRRQDILKDRYGQEYKSPYKKRPGRREREISKLNVKKKEARELLRKQRREKLEDIDLLKDYIDIVCLSVKLNVDSINDISNESVKEDIKWLSYYAVQNKDYSTRQDIDWELVEKIYVNFFL